MRQLRYDKERHVCAIGHQERTIEILNQGLSRLQRTNAPMARLSFRLRKRIRSGGDGL